MSFTNRIEVRVTDLDLQGHVTGAAYHPPPVRVCTSRGNLGRGDARWGVGPVNSETVLRFQRELRGGDSVDITCEWVWEA